MSLPQSVQEIADLLGVPATMALVRVYGGICLKVPVGKVNGMVKSNLVALLGEEKATILMRHYGGERVALARCHSALRDVRDREIIAKYDSGISAARLAIEYEMTERNVRNILKRTPECMDETI